MSKLRTIRIISFLLFSSAVTIGQLANTTPALPTGITTSDNFRTFQGTVMDTTFPVQTGGTTWRPGNGNPTTCTLGVSPATCWGGALEQALISAQPGDTIILQAGAIYTPTVGKPSPPEYPRNAAGSLPNICAGCFTLPGPKVNPQGKWILIESSNMAQLPIPGNRVHPSD